MFHLEPLCAKHIVWVVAVVEIAPLLRAALQLQPHLLCLVEVCEELVHVLC